jgi:hypothetical protein
MTSARPTPPAVRIDRLVVRGGGDATKAERLRQRLPAALSRAFADATAADERAIRRRIERAVREAWR